MQTSIFQFLKVFLCALQEIWSGPRRRYGTFLHSPLLDELKSLEAMLARQAAKRAKNQGAAERPDDPSVTVRMSGDHFEGAQRLSLPMLPSMSSNLAVAQHYEKESASGSPKGAPASLSAGDCRCS